MVCAFKAHRNGSKEKIMSVSRISSRYAKSLLDLAAEQGSLDRIKEDMQAFEKVVAENRDLYLLLKSPIINPGKKKEILQEIFGPHFDKLTLAFLSIVTAKGREEYLQDIAKAFVQQYKVLKKISTITLTTAVSLDADAVNQIRKKLQSSAETQDTIEIITKVNPAIIGGFIAEFDNKRYDASVVYQLEQLKKEFTSSEFVKEI